MPIKKNAKKELRKGKSRVAYNEAVKRQIDHLSKELSLAIRDEKTDEAKKIFAHVVSSLDKAAQRHIIKKNKAGRSKSQLAKLISKATKVQAKAS